jgi:polyphosphate kinase
MVRSFDRRIESLFLLDEEILKKQAINNLRYNLKDNVNSYIMKEDGSYVKKQNGEPPFNIHKEFYHVTKEIVMEAKVI